MHSPASRSLCLVLVLSLLSGVSARADASPLPPMKRLGRGVADRRTGAKLQLACVGSAKTDGERGCELLQFLETDAGGHESLVGPVFDLTQAGKRPSREMRDELRCYGLFRHATTGRFFTFAQIGFGNIGGERRSRCNSPDYSTLSEKEWREKRELKEKRTDKRNSILAPVFVVGGASTLVYFLITGALGTAGVFLFVPGVYASLFVADAITYPFRLIFQGPGGPLGVKAKNVEALESRAKVAWQLKPKKIGHRRFEKLSARLRLLDGRGPKTDLALGETDGVEVFTFVDADDVEDETSDESVAIDSTPETRPAEWTDLGDLGTEGETS